MDRRTFFKTTTIAGFLGANAAAVYYMQARRRNVEKKLVPIEARMTPPKDDHVCSLTFSLQGNSLASVAADDVLSIWDPDANARVFNGPARHGDNVSSIGFLTDNTWLATADRSRIVKFWRPGESSETTFIELDADPTCIAFSPKVKEGVTPPSGIAVAALADHSMRVLAFDANGVFPFEIRLAGFPRVPAGLDSTRVFLELGRMEGHKSKINSLVFSPDGAVLASASDDTTIRLWDTYSWKQIGVLSEHGAPVNSMAFSNDGKRALSADADGYLVLWDVQEKIAAIKHRVGKSPIVKAAFIQGSDWIVAANADRQLKLWHFGNTVQEGLKLPDIPGKYVAIDVSADQHYLAAGWGTDVRFWNSEQLVADARRQLKGT